MALFADSCLKLCRSIYGRVDLTPDARFHTPQQFGNLRKADGAYDHDIHIAITPSCVGSHRAVDKSQIDFSQRRCESFTEYLDEPNCLDQNLLKFREDRAPSISLVIDSISIFLPLEQSGFCKCAKIALDGRGAQVKVPRKLTEIPPFVGLKNRGGQYFLLSRREQRLKQR